MLDLSDLNGTGWVLIVVTIVLALGLGVPLMFLLGSMLPEGRYPRILFMLPTLVIGLIVVVVGRAILGAMNIKITRN